MTPRRGGERLLGPGLALALVAAGPALGAGAGDPWIEQLLDGRKIREAFHETAERLAHDPTGRAAAAALRSLRPSLSAYSPATFEALLRRGRRVKGRRHEDVFLFLEALRRLTPTADGYYDTARGRDLLRQVGTYSRKPALAGLALFELARVLATSQPGRAARFLESLEASSKHVLAPLPRAQAALLRTLCLRRAGQLDGALAAARAGLRLHASTPAPEGGSLEPWFRHSLADVLRARGDTREAARELRRVLGAGDHYAGTEAARRELREL